MSLYDSIYKEYENISLKIDYLNQQIRDLPAGRLNVQRRGQQIRYYRWLDGKSYYLSNSNKDMAEALARKKYYQEMVQDLQLEKEALRKYLHMHKDQNTMQSLLKKQPYLTELLGPLLQPADVKLRTWAEEEYPSTAGHPENLIHQGPNGKMYRSKSEAMIARGLYEKRIPFRYENDKEINGVTYHIDFTIRHPETGRFIYWEHFGAMDMESYSVNVGSKIRTFASVGIVPDRNLILTFETKKYPLSFGMVEDTIERWFGGSN